MIANVTQAATCCYCCCCETGTKLAGPDPWWATLIFLILTMGIAMTLSAFAPYGRDP